MNRTLAPRRRSRFYRSSVAILYATVVASFLTGAGWLVLGTWFPREGEFGPEPNPLQGSLLALHGVLGMAMVLLFGGMLATHVRHFWRKRRSRRTGITLVSSWCLLMISACALYYSGNEAVRAGAHWTHVVVGIGLPLALAVHLLQKES